MIGENYQDRQLRRLLQYKHGDAASSSLLGPDVVDFFKHSVTKRQAKFAKIAEVWNALVPTLLAEHCALDTFSRGSLTVLVDSASHLYDLKTLLLAGLQKQLLLACRSSGLSKVVLKPGRWYDGNDSERKLRFD
jgi:hypothetical protein